MHAAVLLVPLLALGVAVAGAPPMGNLADLNDVAMDLNAWSDASDMNSVEFNTMESMAGPAWLAGGDWMHGGADENGAAWWVDLRTSDLEARPARVTVRVDEEQVPGSRYGFTERELAIDCAKYRYRVLRTRHYDHDGRAAGPEVRGDAAMVRAAPGSVYASLAQEACTGPLTEEMLGNMVTMNGM